MLPTIVAEAFEHKESIAHKKKRLHLFSFIKFRDMKGQ